MNNYPYRWNSNEQLYGADGVVLNSNEQLYGADGVVRTTTLR